MARIELGEKVAQLLIYVGHQLVEESVASRSEIFAQMYPGVSKVVEDKKFYDLRFEYSKLSGSTNELNQFLAGLLYAHYVEKISVSERWNILLEPSRRPDCFFFILGKVQPPGRWPGPNGGIPFDGPGWGGLLPPKLWDKVKEKLSPEELEELGFA